MSVISKFAQTLVNLLGAVDTTVNMANRVVNTADNYVQTVERHAVDYNFESQVVSAKRREQLAEKYRLLSDTEKQAMRSANPFASQDDLEKAAA